MIKTGLNSAPALPLTGASHLSFKLSFFICGDTLHLIGLQWA